MKRIIRLGQLGGLRLLARPTAVYGSLIIWVVAAVVGATLLDLTLVQAILGGLLAVILHWTGELWHQYSHSIAARRTGYPMSGLIMVWVLAASLYPRDEPELPARIHIRRALGGPIGSAALTAVAAIIALALRPTGGLPWYLALFFFGENLLVFTLGAFLPLGFTDGSTLLRYWPHRHD